MKPDNARQGHDFWGELVALLLHPVQIEILEMLLWIERTLSASELTKIYQGEHGLAKVNHHIRRLANLGVVEVFGEHQVGGSLKKPYRLVSKPGNDGSEKK